MLFYLLINLLCLVSCFFVISPRRVPNLRPYPLLSVFLRMIVFWGLSVFFALFSVPIVLGKHIMSADIVVIFGSGMCLFFSLLSVCYIRYLKKK
jgi:hypothetical protein